eukprot:GEMP01062061.1.p1 GENE.GEMP01062061.1~~GEMP01062061.1.p1  ORF type:complete len:214 (+),score=52.52 GEMP01062061.1:348-989(+)
MHEAELHSWIRTLKASVGEDGQSKQPQFMFDNTPGTMVEILRKIIGHKIRHTDADHAVNVAQIGPASVPLIDAILSEFGDQVAFFNFCPYSEPSKPADGDENRALTAAFNNVMEVTHKFPSNRGAIVRQDYDVAAARFPDRLFDVLLLMPSATFLEDLDRWEPKVNFAGILAGQYDEDGMKALLNRQRGFEVFLGMNRTFWWFVEYEEEEESI